MDKGVAKESFIIEQWGHDEYSLELILYSGMTYRIMFSKDKLMELHEILECKIMNNKGKE